MSEDVKKMSRPTFHGEYNKHLSFFLPVPEFEDSFADLYHFEQKARQELLNGTLFDTTYYANHVDSILNAKRAAIAALQTLTPKGPLSDASPDVRSAKFRCTNMGNVSPTKSAGPGH